MEKEVAKFVERYKLEYHLGNIFGERICSKMFDRLPPVTKFEDLKKEEILWLWENHKKFGIK